MKPWSVIDKDYDLGVVITRGDPTNPDHDVARHVRIAYADQIVRAVNNHDARVTALRELSAAEWLDEDDPRLIAAREQAKLALAAAEAS